jgi:hypothetical protein
MTAVPAPAGFAIAWLGASILLLSHARRGVVLGLLLATLGLALSALAAGHGQVAAELAVGGLITSGLRLRDGLPGWGLMPSGSTPRLVMSLVVLILGLLMGATVKGSTPLIEASLMVLGLSAARLLTAGTRAVAMAAAAAMALAMAAMGSGLTALAAAAVAAVLGTVPTGDDVEAAV